MLLLSCEEEKEEVFEKPYFDVKGFIEAEIERLEKEKPTVEKLIITDGEIETHQIDNINWKDELSSFLELDINTPPRRNSFGVDTAFASDSTYTIRYRPFLAGSAIRSLEVTINSYTGKCTSLSGERFVSNYVYQTTEKLLYLTDMFYNIEGSISFRFVFETSYQIKSDFDNITELTFSDKQADF